MCYHDKWHLKFHSREKKSLKLCLTTEELVRLSSKHCSLSLSCFMLRWLQDGYFHNNLILFRISTVRQVCFSDICELTASRSLSYLSMYSWSDIPISNCSKKPWKSILFQIAIHRHQQMASSVSLPVAGIYTVPVFYCVVKPTASTRQNCSWNKYHDSLVSRGHL